jgi:hypothetical protein
MNAGRDFRSVTHSIAIPMQARTQRTQSDVWSQLATTPEWSFTIGDRQNEKKRWNSDQRAIWNSTRWIDAGRRVIRHWGVSDGSDGARPLWRSHSARTEIFFADGYSKVKHNSNIHCILIHTIQYTILYSDNTGGTIQIRWSHIDCQLHMSSRWTQTQSQQYQCTLMILQHWTLHILIHMSKHSL